MGGLGSANYGVFKQRFPFRIEEEKAPVKAEENPRVLGGGWLRAGEGSAWLKHAFNSPTLNKPALVSSLLNA